MSKYWRKEVEIAVITTFTQTILKRQIQNSVLWARMENVWEHIDYWHLHQRCTILRRFCLTSTLSQNTSSPHICPTVDISTFPLIELSFAWTDLSVSVHAKLKIAPISTYALLCGHYYVWMDRFISSNWNIEANVLWRAPVHIKINFRSHLPP